MVVGLRLALVLLCVLGASPDDGGALSSPSPSPPAAEPAPPAPAAAGAAAADAAPSGRAPQLAPWVEPATQDMTPLLPAPEDLEQLQSSQLQLQAAGSADVVPRGWGEAWDEDGDEEGAEPPSHGLEQLAVFSGSAADAASGIELGTASDAAGMQFVAMSPAPPAGSPTPAPPFPEPAAEAPATVGVAVAASRQPLYGFQQQQQQQQQNYQYSQRQQQYYQFYGQQPRYAAQPQQQPRYYEQARYQPRQQAQPQPQQAQQQQVQRSQQQQQQQQGQGQQQQPLPAKADSTKKHSGWGSWSWDPAVPPSWGNEAGAFCDPSQGLEPADNGKCACMAGYGTNLDMTTCARCPIGWYSPGGQVGVAYCKPCPQLTISTPGRTACVPRRNVQLPDTPKSLCTLCPNPSQPFDPPVCCPKGQTCCGSDGCCPYKRCITNTSTGGVSKCCGDDCNCGGSCNFGTTLNCCPGSQICVNSTAAGSTQLCCVANRVCGDGTTVAKQCCNTAQTCCGNKFCCNTGTGATPAQTCTTNEFTGPPANDLACCLKDLEVNCNGTCCRTKDSPQTSQCQLNSAGVAFCCQNSQLCLSDDGFKDCCSAAGQFCTRNTSTSGATIRRCCPGGYSLCPKNNVQPICCPVGKCPQPTSTDACLP